MDEFLGIVYKQYQSFTPVFAAHLNRFRLSRTTFRGMIRMDMTTLLTSVNRMNGTCGNPCNPWATDDSNAGITVPGLLSVVKRAHKHGLVPLSQHRASKRLCFSSPDIKVVSSMYARDDVTTGTHLVKMNDADRIKVGLVSG
jgi:hypothetical protein